MLKRKKKNEMEPVRCKESQGMLVPFTINYELNNLDKINSSIEEFQKKADDYLVNEENEKLFAPYMLSFSAGLGMVAADAKYNMQQLIIAKNGDMLPSSAYLKDEGETYWSRLRYISSSASDMAISSIIEQEYRKVCLALMSRIIGIIRESVQLPIDFKNGKFDICKPTKNLIDHIVSDFDNYIHIDDIYKYACHLMGQEKYISCDMDSIIDVVNQFLEPYLNAHITNAVSCAASIIFDYVYSIAIDSEATCPTGGGDIDDVLLYFESRIVPLLAIFKESIKLKASGMLKLLMFTHTGVDDLNIYNQEDNNLVVTYE